MSHYFERPKFKSIIHYYLNQFCDMEGQLQNIGQEPSNNMQQFPAALKKSLRLFIIEIIPTILVSDGHNFIEAIFTKESINDFRKNYSHVKFSNLRDKVIYVSKWQLQLDHADSMKQFNSFQNINIKLVIEQFKPLMHESLNTRLTHSATSIFRNPEIQTLVKNYRHWFAQTLIQKNAMNQQQSIALPSLGEVFGPNKAKRNSQNEYSQNTTQLSENDNNVTEDFGANIQKSQVFRLSSSELKSDLKVDSHLDFDEFQKQLLVKKSYISTDLRLADIDRIVIQEKGEQFFAEKNFSKSRQWLEQVQDEHRREQLKMQIEYFQVGNQAPKFDSTYETMWQREEREKQQKKFQSTGYRSKRIIGYTFGYTASSIKEKLIRMLDSTKSTSHDIQGYANKQISKAKSVSPTKGRPRSNSQENLLLLTNIDDSKSQISQLQNEVPISREPLSQFVQHQMPVFHDDDTQSEQDSMDNQIEMQLQRERNMQPQEDKVFDGMKPLGISMYKSYLEWFQQNDISHQSYIDVQLARDFEEEARVAEVDRAKKEHDSKRFSFRLVEKNKPKDFAETVAEDVEMAAEEPQNQIIEQSPVKQESDTQLQLEQSEEQELEIKQESGKMSPIEQFILPNDDILMAKEEIQIPQDELFTKQEPQRYSNQKRQSRQETKKLISPERSHSKHESSQSVSPKKNLSRQESQNSPGKSSYSKCDSPKSSSPIKESLLIASSPVKESPKVDSFKASPVHKEEQKEPEVFQTPAKPIIEVNMGIQPPKPVAEMTSGEKAMWDLEIQFQQMKEEMERKQREMMDLFEQKKKAALLMKQEEDRKERERIEQERLEKERIEKEKIRLEKERQEKIRLEKERKEKERQERERKEKEALAMKKREQQELSHMRQEEQLMIKFYTEERKLEQKRIQELQRQIQLEQERLRQESVLKEKIRQEELRQQRMREDRERQEQIQKAEKEKLEKERQQKVAEAQASQVRMTQETIEAEKRRRIQMMQEQRSQQQQPADDWEDGDKSSSYDSDYVKELDKEREAYVQNMNKKFGSTLNQEIRRMETKDMTRRKIKKVENEDKLYDFVKIKNIKLEKMEQQRKQLENSSSSQPSKDSKESKKQQEADESSEKLSSSKSEADDLNQYDLFDNKNGEDELPEIDDQSVEEITQSQLESPSKMKDIEAYPKQDNDQIQNLSAQIAMLQQQLAGAVQSIKILSSQSQVKDQKPQDENCLEEEDDDYHLPAFGSQVSPKKKVIEPFNIGKRNFSQFEEEQQYRQYEDEYKNSPTKQGQFRNLTDFVNHQKMELHKNQIKQQHVERDQRIRQHKQQQRQGQGPQQQPRSSQSTQGVHGRPRERSNSREMMRPPQQMAKQQRPGPPVQRQSQQQSRGPPQGPPPTRPVVRQRSSSPVKQPQQSQGMNVAGNKRYVHSQQNQGVQQQYQRQKMQAPSQSFDPQTTKRRKIVIEDEN